MKDEHCPLCKSGEIGNLWSRDLHLGKKNIEEASIYFRCDRQQVMDHINKHEIVFDESGGYDSPDFYIGKLLRILKTLEDMINYDMIMKKEMTRQDKETMIKVLKECRETLKALGEFQGRLAGKGDVTINVEMINQRYIAITNMLMTEVCDECKLKVIDLMDHLDHQPIKEITTST